MQQLLSQQVHHTVQVTAEYYEHNITKAAKTDNVTSPNTQHGPSHRVKQKYIGGVDKFTNNATRKSGKKARQQITIT